MAYAPSAVAPRDFAPTHAPASNGHESRQRQADREIGRYIRDNGGRLTDNIEREIERRFLFAPSRW
jgi:hypothetical protein